MTNRAESRITGNRYSALGCIIGLKMGLMSSYFARLFRACLRFGFFGTLLGNTLDVFNVVTGTPHLEKEDDAQYGTQQDYELRKRQAYR